MRLVELDAVREEMLREIERDVAESTLYISPRLTRRGAAAYVDLLREAVSTGNPSTLAESLASPGMLRPTESSTSSTGRHFEKAVPYNANETLAEGEFNRFYIRGVCLHVVETGGSEVEIYRAKEVAYAREKSEALVGRRRRADQLLADVRAHAGRDTLFGIPGGANSGISVRFVR